MPPCFHATIGPALLVLCDDERGLHLPATVPPCPFCGEREYTIETDFRWPLREPETSVRCEGCDSAWPVVYGPVHPSPVHATR